MTLYWKELEIYRFSRSATQSFLRWPIMVADNFKDFEPPSKKFLATPLIWDKFNRFTTNVKWNKENIYKTS